MIFRWLNLYHLFSIKIYILYSNGKYALVYNSRNGKVQGLRRLGQGLEPLPPVSETGSNGEEYMAVFAYLSMDGNDGLCDTEFVSHFFDLHEHFATTDSKIIAQALGYPHFVFTCGPNTEETSLMVSILPNIDSCTLPKEDWPTMEDFSMDPATAVAELTGTYPAGIPKEEAFRKILEEIYQRGYDRAKGEKDFIKKESTIIQACRMPSVIEIQEVSMIEKPGTLTRLNALFDDCAKTDLLNGELIERHPDTVVIFTANLDYIGCQMFNESVLSRMNLIQHRKGMSAKDMARALTALAVAFAAACYSLVYLN